jgi:hypothetical protein
MPFLEGLWEIITDSGVTLEFGRRGVGIRRMAGIGLPTAQYVTQQAPGQHGQSHLGFTLQPREVPMQLQWDGCLVDVRTGKVYPGLNYLDSPLTLRRTLRDQTARELRDVWYNGGLVRDSDAIGADGFVESQAVLLVARDPVWWDSDQSSHAVTLATDFTGDELVFDTPAGVPGPTAIFATADYLTFGSSTINTTLSAGEVATLGDWYAWPVITIVGPASDPEIENLTTGQQITMDYDVPAGRTVTIDLRWGHKTVEDDLGTNLAGYVPATDDLATFVLWPHPLATDGENEIRLFAGNATVNTSITVAWNDRYQGI